MNEADRQDYVTRYEARLKEFGYSPQTLGWGKHGRQAIRFSVLAADALRDPACSVLDVGCGFGDLYDFLVQRGWHGRYTGVDIVPGLLETGKERNPELDLRLVDMTEPPREMDRFDYVIASGVINARLAVGDNPSHIVALTREMVNHANRAVCLDFMNTFVDFEKPGSWHSDPAWMIGLARQLTPRFVLRCDYMPYESALLLYTESQVSSENVFAAFVRGVENGPADCRP